LGISIIWYKGNVVILIRFSGLRPFIMKRKYKQWWSTIPQYQQSEQSPLTSNN